MSSTASGADLTSTSEPSFIIQRFSAVWCPNCRTMKTAKTLERFVMEHPNLKVEDYDLDNPAAEERADELDIDGIPAFVFIDSDGQVVHKEEGALTMKGVEKMYAKVLKNLDEGNLGAMARPKSRRKRKGG